MLQVIPSFRKWALCLWSAGVFWLIGAVTAAAHPHVIVTVRTEVVISTEGRITALKHRWTFDEPFSAYATMGMDTDKDGKLSREELTPLAKVNVESLQEYAFFTYLKEGKRAVSLKEPVDYWLDHDGKALTLNFTLPVADAPPLAKETRMEVYDPSYFVAFGLAEPNPITVSGAACTVKLRVPGASVTQRLSQLSEDFFQSFRGKDGASEWATTITFACP